MQKQYHVEYRPLFRAEALLGAHAIVACGVMKR